MGVWISISGGQFDVDKPLGSVVLLPETSPIKVLAHLHKDIAIGTFTVVFFFVIARYTSG